MKENKRLLVLVTMFLLGVFTESFSQSLDLSKKVYIHDETSSESILITFREGPGNAKDWIGIYKKGQIPGEIVSTLWAYVDGSKNGINGVKAGVIQFDDALEPGSYEAYFLEDDGYVILASALFEVSEEAEAPKVSLSQEEYEEGEEIEVIFSGGPGNAKDCLGLYSEGEFNEEEDILGWSYVCLLYTSPSPRH